MAKRKELTTAQADTVARAKMLTDPTDPTLTTISLNSEIDALADLLDIACTQGESAATISTIIDLRGKLRLAQSRVNDEIIKRSDVWETAEKYAEFLLDECPTFDAESYLKVVSDQLKMTEVSEDQMLRDLSLLRKLLATTTDAATICKLAVSIVSAVKVATELGISSGILLSESDAVEAVKRFVHESKDYFPDGMVNDEFGTYVDRACQRMSEVVKT